MMSLHRLLPVNTNNFQLRTAFVVLSLCMCLFITKQWVTFNERPVISVTKWERQFKRPSSDSDYAYKYNLLDGVDDAFSRLAADHAECTLDYMNANKLAQDHPCVIDTIRRHYLHNPSPLTVPYNLTDDDKERPGYDDAESRDYQSAQSPYIVRLLKNKTEGFFLECGAADGKFLSSTLYMERSLKWTGVLIEANPHNYQKLLARNRKAWTLPVCLSIEPYPTRESFVSVKAGPASAQTHIVESDLNGNKLWDAWDDPDRDTVTVQCFPLYSILLALNRTRVDFLALDIEGHELKVLKTVPFHKVDIRTMTVEWLRIRDAGEKGGSLSRFLESNGYLFVGTIEDMKYTTDSLFIKDTLNEPERREFNVSP